MKDSLLLWSYKYSWRSKCKSPLIEKAPQLKLWESLSLTIIYIFYKSFFNYYNRYNLRNYSLFIFREKKFKGLRVQTFLVLMYFKVGSKGFFKQNTCSLQRTETFLNFFFLKKRKKFYFFFYFFLTLIMSFQHKTKHIAMHVNLEWPEL